MYIFCVILSTDLLISTILGHAWRGNKSFVRIWHISKMTKLTGEHHIVSWTWFAAYQSIIGLFFLLFSIRQTISSASTADVLKYSLSFLWSAGLDKHRPLNQIITKNRITSSFVVVIRVVFLFLPLSRFDIAASTQIFLSHFFKTIPPSQTCYFFIAEKDLAREQLAHLQPVLKSEADHPWHAHVC